MEHELTQLLSEELREEERKLVESSLEYLRKHKGRLNYCGRLPVGRVIGSGLIEEACKNLVGHRLKRGACWRLERANKMALICALLYADHGNSLGNTPTKLWHTP